MTDDVSILVLRSLVQKKKKKKVSFSETPHWLHSTGNMTAENYGKGWGDFKRKGERVKKEAKEK